MMRIVLQLVVVSPLRRTLETAAGVFGATAPPAAAAATQAAATAAASDHTSSSNSSWIWMHPQQHKATEVTRRVMIYLPAAGAAAAAAAAAYGNRGVGSSAAAGDSAGSAASQQQQQQQHVPLRIVAHEGCRERIGEWQTAYRIPVAPVLCVTTASQRIDHRAMMAAWHSLQHQPARHLQLSWHVHVLLLVHPSNPTDYESPAKHWLTEDAWSSLILLPLLGATSSAACRHQLLAISLPVSPHLTLCCSSL
jgi:hypothetical protein